MAKTLIHNIGECFTGDIARPMADVTSLLVDGTTIAAFNPPAEQVADGKVDQRIDAQGGAVLPGLVDGHVHPVFGEWTPTQDAIGWIGNYLHGGTTSMVSACELHIPGLNYNALTPELVTSIAIVTANTTGRVRWSGVKLVAGTVILVPGMTESHFDRLAANGTKYAKFLFYPLDDAHKEEAQRYVRQLHERGIRVKVHTGGVSRSGASVMCGYRTLEWLQPDVAAHVSGGPIPMSDEDLDQVVDNTRFALEVCSSANDKSTLRAVTRLAKNKDLARLVMGTDTPGGTGVIPRGMWRNIQYLAGVCELPPAVAIAVATGNTARAHGLDVGILDIGRPADLLVAGPIQGSPGSKLSESLAHGDIPGIAQIMIDGELVVRHGSRQTPPPAKPGLWSCCNPGWLSALGSAAGGDRTTRG